MTPDLKQLLAACKPYPHTVDDVVKYGYSDMGGGIALMQSQSECLRAQLAVAVAMLERLQPLHLSSGLRIGDDPQFKEVLRALGSDTP